MWMFCFVLFCRQKWACPTPGMLHYIRKRAKHRRSVGNSTMNIATGLYVFVHICVLCVCLYVVMHVQHVMLCTHCLCSPPTCFFLPSFLFSFVLACDLASCCQALHSSLLYDCRLVDKNTEHNVHKLLIRAFVAK